jgi:hypothetical protein
MFNRSMPQRSPRAFDLRAYLEANLPGLIPQIGSFLDRYESRPTPTPTPPPAQPPTPPMRGTGQIEQMPGIPYGRRPGTIPSPRRS